MSKEVKNVKGNRKNTIYYKSSKAICSKFGYEEYTKYLAMFLDMMAFQVFETLIILTLASILDIILESIVFMIFFILFRIGHKGIHANTRFKCIVYSTLMILSTSYIGSVTSIYIVPLLGIAFAILLRKENE